MEKLEQGVKALGISLTARQIGQFEQYFQLLMDWNERINLTSITDYEEAQLKHFLDSLTPVIVADFSRELDVIDIGTGGGFPGIPLKIALPDLKMTLLEATKKKTEFLKQAVSEIGLTNVEIIADRAEIIAHDDRYREKYDIVLARAVAILPTLVELALPFCKTGGIFIAQKKGITEKQLEEILEGMNIEIELALPVCRIKDRSKGPKPTEIEQAYKVIKIMGGTLQQVKTIELDELNDDRMLVVIKKISPTPRKYPRRPGIPEKRPITS